MSYLYLGRQSNFHFFVGFVGTMASQIYNAMINDARINSDEYVCVLNGDECTVINHTTSPMMKVDADNISNAYRYLFAVPRENTHVLLYVEENDTILVTYEVPWFNLPIAGLPTTIAHIEYVTTIKPINY
jgi:hypothetical protein